MERSLLKPYAPDKQTRLLESLHSLKPVSGLTHTFYRYPARMSPDLAREVIRLFSQPNDTVLDPFMGGGTTVVESLACGRYSVGIDINPLATFITSAKTTPLSPADARIVKEWASAAPLNDHSCEAGEASWADPRLKNLPELLVTALEQLLHSILALPFPRQQRFARCALLRLGQWAVESKCAMPDRESIRDQLSQIVNDMLSGLDGLVQSARAYGVAKHKLTSQRTILLRSSVGLEQCFDATWFGPRPRLILTSPPYPAVHVLYHRWQVRGRRETPAPYWLIGAKDGRGASYFTFGSRTPFGIDNYFRTLTAAYTSLRAVIDAEALVVQLVAFSDTESQLPAFLRAMEAAGFREDTPLAASRADLWRTVPNRNWYYRINPARGSARELLLFHRPAPQFS